MELWLPWLGSRLPLRGGEQATLERGFWLTRLPARPRSALSIASVWP
jgi:hypothetical protein